MKRFKGATVLQPQQGRPPVPAGIRRGPKFSQTVGHRCRSPTEGPGSKGHEQLWKPSMVPCSTGTGLCSNSTAALPLQRGTSPYPSFRMRRAAGSLHQD